MSNSLGISPLSLDNNTNNVNNGPQVSNSTIDTIPDPVYNDPVVDPVVDDDVPLFNFGCMFVDMAAERVYIANMFEVKLVNERVAEFEQWLAIDDENVDHENHLLLGSLMTKQRLQELYNNNRVVFLDACIFVDDNVLQIKQKLFLAIGSSSSSSSSWLPGKTYMCGQFVTTAMEARAYNQENTTRVENLEVMLLPFCEKMQFGSTNKYVLHYLKTFSAIPTAHNYKTVAQIKQIIAHKKTDWDALLFMGGHNSSRMCRIAYVYFEKNVSLNTNDVGEELRNGILDLYFPKRSLPRNDAMQLNPTKLLRTINAHDNFVESFKIFEQELNNNMQNDELKITVSNYVFVRPPFLLNQNINLLSLFQSMETSEELPFIQFGDFVRVYAPNKTSQGVPLPYLSDRELKSIPKPNVAFLPVNELRIFRSIQLPNNPFPCRIIVSIRPDSSVYIHGFRHALDANYFGSDFFDSIIEPIDYKLKEYYKQNNLLTKDDSYFFCVNFSLQITFIDKNKETLKMKNWEGIHKCVDWFMKKYNNNKEQNNNTGQGNGQGNDKKRRFQYSYLRCNTHPVPMSIHQNPVTKNVVMHIKYVSSISFINSITINLCGLYMLLMRRQQRYFVNPTLCKATSNDNAIEGDDFVDIPALSNGNDNNNAHTDAQSVVLETDAHNNLLGTEVANTVNNSVGISPMSTIKGGDKEDKEQEEEQEEEEQEQEREEEEEEEEEEQEQKEQKEQDDDENENGFVLRGDVKKRRLDQYFPFLNNKNSKGTYYSKMCPVNRQIDRRPLVMTKDELADFGYDAADKSVLQFGLDEDRNPLYLTCPKYWCVFRNRPVSKEEILSGVCGPPGMPLEVRGKRKKLEDFLLSDNVQIAKRQLSRGERFVYRFHDDEEQYPGFINKSKGGINGQCVPCCFKKNKAKLTELVRHCQEAQKNFAQGNNANNGNGNNNMIRKTYRSNNNNGLISFNNNDNNDVYALFNNNNNNDDDPEYIFKNEKRIAPGRRGWLMPVLMRMLKYDNPRVKSHYKLLRYGVKGGFLGAIALAMDADRANDGNQVALAMANNLTCSMFAGMQNGEIMTSFCNNESKMNTYKDNNGFMENIQVAREKITMTPNWIHTLCTDPNLDNELVRFNMDLALDNFIKGMGLFLFTQLDMTDDNDHTMFNYRNLWNLVTEPTSINYENAFFIDGINLVVLDCQTRGEVKMVCPPGLTKQSNFDETKNTLVLLRMGQNTFEPMFATKQTPNNNNNNNNNNNDDNDENNNENNDNNNNNNFTFGPLNDSAYNGFGSDSSGQFSAQVRSTPQTHSVSDSFHFDQRQQQEGQQQQEEEEEEEEGQEGGAVTTRGQIQKQKEEAKQRRIQRLQYVPPTPQRIENVRTRGQMSRFQQSVASSALASASIPSIQQNMQDNNIQDNMQDIQDNIQDIQDNMQDIQDNIQDNMQDIQDNIQDNNMQDDEDIQDDNFDLGLRSRRRRPRQRETRQVQGLRAATQGQRRGNKVDETLVTTFSSQTQNTIMSHFFQKVVKPMWKKCQPSYPEWYKPGATLDEAIDQVLSIKPQAVITTLFISIDFLVVGVAFDTFSFLPCVPSGMPLSFGDDDAIAKQFIYTKQWQNYVDTLADLNQVVPSAFSHIVNPATDEVIGFKLVAGSLNVYIQPPVPRKSTFVSNNIEFIYENNGGEFDYMIDLQIRQLKHNRVVDIERLREYKGIYTENYLYYNAFQHLISERLNSPEERANLLSMRRILGEQPTPANIRQQIVDILEPVVDKYVQFQPNIHEPILLPPLTGQQQQQQAQQGQQGQEQLYIILPEHNSKTHTSLKQQYMMQFVDALLRFPNLQSSILFPFAMKFTYEPTSRFSLQNNEFITTLIRINKYNPHDFPQIDMQQIIPNNPNQINIQDFQDLIATAVVDQQEQEMLDTLAHFSDSPLSSPTNTRQIETTRPVTRPTSVETTPADNVPSSLLRAFQEGGTRKEQELQGKQKKKRRPVGGGAYTTIKNPTLRKWLCDGKKSKKTTKKLVQNHFISISALMQFINNQFINYGNRDDGDDDNDNDEDKERNNAFTFHDVCVYLEQKGINYIVFENGISPEVAMNAYTMNELSAHSVMENVLCLFSDFDASPHTPNGKHVGCLNQLIPHLTNNVIVRYAKF